MADCVGPNWDDNCPYNGQRTGYTPNEPNKYKEGLKYLDRSGASYLCDQCKDDIRASYPKFKCRVASCNNLATITHLEDHMASLGLDEEEFCDECKNDFAHRMMESYHASYYDLQPEQLYGTEYDHLNTLDNEPQPYEPDPIEKAWRFLKAQMSDVHLGFQEDPEREIARLMHMGLSRQEAMGLYQQYLDSLGSGA